jgi:hypothetical protein
MQRRRSRSVVEVTTDTNQARIARLEERVGLIHLLVTEIRSDQKQMREAIASASGGLRVLMLLGGLAGAAGALRGLIAVVAGWMPHAH